MFEQNFKIKWVEQKHHAFFLAFFYTLVGFISARLIFPSSTGLMSVAFTSILLIPSLAMLLKMEENVEIREKKFHLIQLFKDHKEIFKVYIYMFLGIFIAYSFVTLFYQDISMFEPQLRVAGLTGYAFADTYLGGIIINNLIVFAVCFLLSLVYGAGSLLFLTWNASVWGVVFAATAKMSVGGNAFLKFGTNMLPILPHMITEALAYVFAAIVGGVVSAAVLREKIGSKKFKHVLTDAVILLVIGIVLVFIAGYIEIIAYS
tara:strand:+ start:715 stop:1497 length:783 start_codon:yes stop_codon:yes gene_type:complete